MNIFFLDYDIPVSVRQYCDKHVVKITLEVAQMLSTVVQEHAENVPHYIYRKAYANHPMTKWIASGKTNYALAWTYGKSLYKEYRYRYGKKHASQDIIDWCSDCFPNIPTGYSNPPQCMPDEFKQRNFIHAYQAYYRYKQTQIDMRWTNRPVPEFLNV